MKKVTIFGRAGCGFCVRAKELCEAKGFQYRYVDIHLEGVSKADLERTAGSPVETVPQIFSGKYHIGGYTEFSEMVLRQGL
ncbi:MAG: GrxA family glutaredoxin [Motiliproteus sp.]